MSENEFWVKIWCMIFTTLMCVVLGICLVVWLGQRDLIRAGFTREVMASPASAGVQWTKK